MSTVVRAALLVMSYDITNNAKTGNTTVLMKLKLAPSLISISLSSPLVKRGVVGNVVRHYQQRLRPTRGDDSEIEMSLCFRAPVDISTGTLASIVFPKVRRRKAGTNVNRGPKAERSY